jgi:hypothetical protein
MAGIPCQTVSALTLHFDRTVRQIPKWREFVRNAADKRLTPEQSAEVPNLAKDVVEALRDEDAREFVDPSIPEALQLLQAPLQPAGENGTDRPPLENDQIKPGLAEDILESINNVIKRAVEPVIGTAKEMASGYAKEARKSLVTESERRGKETGPAITKWLKRAIFGGGLIGGLIKLGRTRLDGLKRSSRS